MPGVSEQGSGLLEPHKYKEDVRKSNPFGLATLLERNSTKRHVSRAASMLRAVGVSHRVLVLDSTTIKIKEGPNYKIMFEKLNI